MTEESVAPWTPPGLDESELEEFLAFVDGVPSGSKGLLRTWITKAIPKSKSLHYGEQYLAGWPIAKFQLLMNKDYGWPIYDELSSDHVLACVDRLVDRDFIFFIDFILGHCKVEPDTAKFLDNILRNGRSNWQVGKRDKRPGLVSRIPAAVVEVVETLTDKPSAANNLLRRAWAKAYGPSPDAPGAYASAVKAVEVYSTQVFNPKTSLSTLGKDNAAFRAKPEKWEFDLGSDDPRNLEHLLGMMELLWNNHHDRHGSQNYKDVSIEEAQAAVLLASTLVGWFDKGMIRLKS